MNKKVVDYLNEDVKKTIKLSDVRKKLEEENVGDQITTKNGNILVRKGYFYSSGGSEEKLASRITPILDSMNIKYTIVDKGNVWRSFKGGAPIAKQSHWYVEIKINE